MIRCWCHLELACLAVEHWNNPVPPAPLTRKNQDVNKLLYVEFYNVPLTPAQALQHIYIARVYGLPSSMRRLRFISCSTIADRKYPIPSEWRQVGYTQSNQNSKKSISNLAQDQTPCMYLLKLSRGIFIYGFSVFSTGIITVWEANFHRAAWKRSVRLSWGAKRRLDRGRWTLVPGWRIQNWRSIHTTAHQSFFYWPFHHGRWPLDFSFTLFCVC